MNKNGITDLCDNHPQMEAIAFCEVCGKPVCGDCAVAKLGAYFCNDASHQTIFERYTTLCESQSMFEAELIAKNLEANGISVQWFERSRYRKDFLPALYVLTGSVENAMTILQSLDLLDFIIPENNVKNIR
ncbi:MAG: B-box zinc finger protein [Bacteroidota bacterium]